MDEVSSIEKKDERWRWGPSTYFQITGLFIAAIAVAVSVYFSETVQVRKALSLRYIAKLSLISPEASRSGKLNITYNDQVTDSLWILSARLENTGTQPIEKRDIEKNMLLKFDAAKILGVEISDKNPREIEAIAEWTRDAVTIKHGLMNPGDWIGFEILFDGTPNWPEASFRISGVSSPTIILPFDKPTKFSATFFDLSRPMEYVLLVITSLTVLFLTAIGFMLIFSSIGSFIKGPKYHRQLLERGISPGQIHYTQRNLSENSNLVVAVSGVRPKWDWIDNIEDAKKELSSGISENLLNKLEIDIEASAEQLVTEMRAEFPNALANYFYQQFPRGVDRQAQETVRQMSMDSGTAEEFVQKALIELTGILATYPVRRSFDSGEMIGGAVVLFIGTSSALILSGTWRLILLQ